MKVKEIKGTITLEDGSTSEFSIVADIGWQQWGADQARLGKTSELLTELSEAAGDFFENEEEHKDLSQHYADGFFWTRCNCGEEFPGRDEGEADNFQMAHREGDEEQLEQLYHDGGLPRPRPWA